MLFDAYFIVFYFMLYCYAIWFFTVMLIDASLLCYLMLHCYVIWCFTVMLFDAYFIVMLFDAVITS